MLYCQQGKHNMQEVQSEIRHSGAHDTALTCKAVNTKPNGNLYVHQHRNQ